MALKRWQSEGCPHDTERVNSERPVVQKGVLNKLKINQSYQKREKKEEPMSTRLLEIQPNIRPLKQEI